MSFKRMMLTGLMSILPFIAALGQMKLNYTIGFKQPQAHYVEVEMNISGLSKPFVDVKMPAWAPGSYLIREFAKNVEGFSAKAGSTQVKVEKLSKNTWRVYNGKAKAVQINYSVYAFEVSIRTSFVDASHAFLSPPGVFMYPDKQLALPATVKVIPFEGWSKVSTGLEPVPGSPFTYTAKNFDILLDSPIEVGNQDVFEFMASGVKHEVAMYGGGNYNAERIKADLPKIVAQSTKIFGENPNKHYTFIIHNLSKAGGGLEHLNSTVLGVARNSYATELGYNRFLELVAHEYFHLWNVKRLRPVALGPFDYENENYTTNLWIAEGFTSYYASKLMLRSGFVSPEEYIAGQLTNVAYVLNLPGGRVQSAAESSFDTWIKQYRPNENSGNSAISYYSKGEVIGLLLDLEIVNATKGVKSLDDVMKAMYLQGETTGKGYTDAEFKAMAEKISGMSLSGFWAKYVNGVDPVDYKKYFGYAGINVRDENEGKSIPYLGATTIAEGDEVYVTAVSRNSGAWIDGLNVGDQLISINGIKVGPGVERSAGILNKKVGEVITLKIKRDLQDKEIKVRLGANPNVRLSPSMIPDMVDAQRLVLKSWMGN